MKLLILNGPNLNLLGIREPELYGQQSYETLVRLVSEHAAARGVDVTFYQSNHEGDLVDAIQNAYFSKTDGIVFNPAAYTHTSVAVADAVKAVGIPTVEVHITDVDAREPFRRVSYLRPAAVYTIAGQGLDGYNQAVDFLIGYLEAGHEHTH
ncbi:MAG: type II 3-dehydroquinate dehydratase [Oscillospiraceae bacterium]|nr:type II 3-dehydroquinate dehydratase [Oscillospiraceae bacterium]